MKRVRRWAISIITLFALIGGAFIVFVMLGLDLQGTARAAQVAALEIGARVFGDLILSWVPEGGPGAYVALYLLTMWPVVSAVLFMLLIALYFAWIRHVRYGA